MIEDGALELRAVIFRLQSATADLGLTRADVASILRRAPGAWPMPVVDQWSPIERWQEARLRDLCEVCLLLEAVFGSEAVIWLRRSGPGLRMTPIDFLKSDADALSALRDVLRLQRAIA